MQAEGFLTPVNVASSLFFESPEAIFERVHREIRPRTAVPPIEVQFKAFANADSHVRLEKDQIAVRITDLLEGAPAPVIEALAHILLGKLYRKPAARQYESRYRLYLNRRDMRRRIHLVRQERGRKNHRGAQGAIHNLDAIFEDLNHEHFGSMMARPELGWSHTRSRTRLGHFDPSHNMIVISRIFDDPRAPKLALEYVMFHEMLHLRYPVDHSGARRCVHTPEFKAHEREFPYYKEAKALLRKMW
ncbi:MAG TPA: SprT-like domain-containing protein [Bryobacteraceae bacterium]|nr:SprT-like domain-containing protein [Bryobacteraceae bacterium]